jgi:hypothetical protein
VRPSVSEAVRRIGLRVVIILLALFLAQQAGQWCSPQETGGRFAAESDAVRRIAVSIVRRAEVTGQPPSDAQFLQESRAYLQAQRPSTRMAKAGITPVRNSAGDTVGYRITYQLADDRGTLDVNVCADNSGEVVGCAGLASGD